MATNTITNTVTYKLPPGVDAIGTSGVVAQGNFTVAYCYGLDGTFQTATIVSSNITTSGGTGSNTIYNNIFNEKSTNTFDALGTKTTGNGDHIGASIKFDPISGQLDVKFQELQGSTITGSGSGSDYNQLSFTFKDTAVISPLDANRYDVARTISIDNITEHYQIDGTSQKRYESISDDDPSKGSSTIVDSSGNDILTAACYTRGTLIMTAAGEVAIEELSVGDQVMTVSGTLEPVIWLGNSTIHCERQLHQDKAYPVRILKDAFGTNLPKRDLFVSPDHSIYIDGVMIPAYCLINGSTITQDKTETLVTYYHLELPKHNAILAEGLPAESYLETSEENRHFFKQSNASNVTKLDAQYPVCPEDTPAWQHIWDTQGYAKLTQSGPVLEAVKARLAVLAQELLNNRLAA